MKSLKFSKYIFLLGSFFLLSSCSEQINSYCTNKYPSNFLSVLECKFNEGLDNYKAEEEEKREVKARDCIARDLIRMEREAISLLENVRIIHNKNSTSSEVDIATDKLDKILKNQSKIIPKDNIKESTIVGKIPTKCNSQFHFLVNIRFDQNKNIRNLKQYAISAPEGYQNNGLYGYHSEFSVDFDNPGKFTDQLDDEIKRRKILNPNFGNEANGE
jgi:hypothetical protein